MKITLNKKRKKLLTGALVILFLYSLIGFIVVPLVLKPILIKTITQATGRSVTIEKLRFNPYNLKLRILDFDLKDLSGSYTFVSFDEFLLNLQLSSIVRRAPVVKQVKLTRLYARVIRKADKSFNFTDLIKGAEEKVPDEKAASTEFRYSFANIEVIEGRIEFIDRLMDKSHLLEELTLSVPFISNLPYYEDIYVEPYFYVLANETPVEIKGSARPFEDRHETNFDLDILELDIPYYSAYSPIALGFNLTGGLLSAGITLSFVQSTAPGFTPPAFLMQGDIELRGIKTRSPLGAPLIDLPVVDINIASAEPFQNKFNLGNIFIDSARVYLERDRWGGLNLMALLPEEAPAKKAQDERSKGKTPLFTGIKLPVALDIDRFEILNSTVLFTDRTTKTPFRRLFEPVNLKVVDFSSAPEKEAQINFLFKNNVNELISLKGAFSINPLTVDLDLEARELSIPIHQPYIEERLNIILTDGQFATKGRIKAGPTEDESALSASFTGEAMVTSLKSINRADSEDFINFDTLSVTDINLGYNPDFVKVGGVALSDFYALVVIDSDARINLQEVVSAKEEGGADKAATEKRQKENKEGKTPFVSIDTVTLQGGRVNFVDNYIKPRFSARINELGGAVTGLTSLETESAEVILVGKLAKVAPIDITGRINPLISDLFVDLKVDFKGFELSSLTPYTTKYIGHAIERGKLSLDLKYDIDKKKLKATNSVLLDQIAFGARVESETATKLPVKFVLNLLKNRKGEVWIDLPVTGSTDDPEFKIGGIIIKLFVKMILKAATSPFALLGALVGGGEELGYVEFDAGGFALQAGDRKKIDSLIEALYERPGLALDIAGYIARDADSREIRENIFLRSLKRQKLKKLLNTKKAGNETPSLDDIRIEEKEYKKYLWAAYKKTEFPKPRNVIGMTKKLLPEEMKKLMLAHLEVTDDMLKSLAAHRAGSVRDYILSTNKIEPARVFIIWPESLSPEADEGLKASRVEFILK